MESEDYLHALETTGKILLFTPVLVSLILFTGGASNMEPFTGSGAFFANGLMMSAGFFSWYMRQSCSSGRVSGKTDKRCLNKRLKQIKKKNEKLESSKKLLIVTPYLN